MKIFLMAFYLCLFLNSMSQENKLAENHFIGKWKAVSDSLSSKSFIIQFIDKENLELSVDTLTFRFQYIIEFGKDTCVLSLLRDKTSANFMILIPEDQNIFYFNTIEDHERNLVDEKTRPGNLGWGWSNPAPIKFVRQ